MKFIYLVMEAGAGVVHHAYTNKADALEHAANRNKATGTDNYYVAPLELD